jgi:hypothetical protein
MKRVNYVLPLAALTALFVLTLFPATAHADSYDIAWTGTFGSGSVIVDATSEGGGEFLITSLTGTQAGLSLTWRHPVHMQTITISYGPVEVRVRRVIQVM